MRIIRTTLQYVGHGPLICLWAVIKLFIETATHCEDDVLRFQLPSSDLRVPPQFSRICCPKYFGLTHESCDKKMFLIMDKTVLLQSTCLVELKRKMLLLEKSILPVYNHLLSRLTYRQRWASPLKKMSAISDIRPQAYYSITISQEIMSDQRFLPYSDIGLDTILSLFRYWTQPITDSPIPLISDFLFLYILSRLSFFHCSALQKKPVTNFDAVNDGT